MATTTIEVKTATLDSIETITNNTHTTNNKTVTIDRFHAIAIGKDKANSTKIEFNQDMHIRIFTTSVVIHQQHVDFVQHKEELPRSLITTSLLHPI